MNCSRVKEILVDYVEGALSVRKKAAVKNHLSACETCRGELSRIETLKKNILSVETPELGADFWHQFNRNLSQRLAEFEKPTADRRFLRRPRLSFAAAAAMVLFALLSFGILRGTREPANTDPAPDPETTWVATIEPDDLDIGLFISDDYDEADVYLSDGDTETIEQFADDLLMVANGDFELLFEESLFEDSDEESLNEMIEDLSEEEFEELYRRMEST
jgi:hypothetical protein